MSTKGVRGHAWEPYWVVQAFLQRAEAWEKQKRLRAFAAKQQPAHVNDENQPRERQRNAPKQQQTGRARQQPRQALRF